MSLHSQSNQVAIYAFKKGYRILPNGHVVSPRNIERKREATIASHSHIMKWNEEEVAMIKNYHKTSHSYRKTMTRFGISSKGTLHFILKNR